MLSLTKKTHSNRIQDTARDKVTNCIITAILLFASFISVYPLWYTILASFSDVDAVGRGDVWLWPVGLNLSAYEALLQESTLWRAYGNTIVYTTLYVFLQLAFTLPVAYALSRPHFPGKMFFVIFFMIPMYVGGGTVPDYLLVRDLGLYNHFLVMVIPWGVAFYYIMITKNYFSGNIPESLFESARLDGASTTGFFFRFVLPLSKPIISSLTLFFAIPKWNTYMEGVLYIQDMKKQTLQVAIKQITAEIDVGVLDWMTPEMIKRLTDRQQLLTYAVVVVSALPLMLLYPAVQKFLIGGIMLGAVKE